ncbi:hypothetical protein CONPUDRAFT_90431 [Coniophora puteana RWD-64-598 SS2]|uniref:GH3 middle domain-containing protein n=1 Tax=Coniophora puteana (strain RWD-64-598) TaxID=741705 RepID=A0A5M3MR76_CONPW|nr:uncharacterized protein CONPUDRAFT_90431 [Coniophora puteana RWD-64-598 SS2]EIW81567.1 hypothetical protein CONPUDRAFT_90431 [Coniophora puteana RWD-64-598 SS2]
MSSTTSGKASKPVPKYRKLFSRDPNVHPPPTTLWASRADSLTCRPVYVGYKRFVDVQSSEEGGVNIRLPCTALSAPAFWFITGFADFERDHERLSEIVPGTTAPFGASLISNYRSFLLVHAAFALAEESLDTIAMMWSTTFMDFIHWMDEEWSTLVDAVSTGKLPQFPETEDVYSEVASTFSANVARAQALSALDPPSRTAEGWVKKLWPDLELLVAVTSGTFGRVYPQVRALIGPEIPIRCPLYGSTECSIAVAYDDHLPNVLKVTVDDYIEFLEVTPTNDDGELKTLWNVEVGKVYEPVATTRDGLWRYRTRDSIEVVGFSPIDGSPLIEYKERRNQSMWVAQALVSQADILAAISQIDEFDQMELTSWWDDRSQPATVGLFLEDSPSSRSMSSSVRDKILDGLLEANENFASGAKRGLPVRPSIRLLAPGTFAEFRSWKGKMIGVGSSQVKLPIIMLDPKAQDYLLSKVINEIP